MSFTRQCTRILNSRTKLNIFERRLKSSVSNVDTSGVDEDGIPLKPTWSVNELLSSYPRPTISPSTLKRMYELSALVPPAEGTHEHADITREMEDLVKLVEAVKLVHVDPKVVHADHGIPDGRVWAEGTGIPLDSRKSSTPEEEEAHGRALLKHAQRTHNGFYVVDKSSRKE